MTTNNRYDLGLKDAGGGCSCCATGSAPADTEARAASPITHDILVSGMTCSHCVASVTDGLTAIDGVDDVSVELDAGGTSRVQIRSTGSVEAMTVRNAIEAAGYAVADARS